MAGTVIAGSSCQTLVGLALEETLCIGHEHSIRERPREFGYDGADHNAPGRAEVDPTACFAPLLRWLLSYGHGPRVALALYVTTHTDQLTAIVVSLLAHGRAIPVAWHLLAGNQPGTFIAPAVARMARLAPALAGRYEVTLAADRGLWSPPLADAVDALGWQPLPRVQRSVSIWLGRGQRVRFRLIGLLLGHHAGRGPRLVPAPWPDLAQQHPLVPITSGPLHPPPHHIRPPTVNLPL